MKNDCVFCEKIVAGDYIGSMLGCVWFEPLNPVVPGHLLVVPVVHTVDFGENRYTSANVMGVAATLSKEYKDYNIITSAGTAATQSVFHLHVHIVPRHEGDGLKLPWTDQLGKGVLPTDTHPWQSH